MHFIPVHSFPRFIQCLFIIMLYSRELVMLYLSALYITTVTLFNSPINKIGSDYASDYSDQSALCYIHQVGKEPSRTVAPGMA